jgi:glycosyltransferase involved in cell wall biosynthesis
MEHCELESAFQGNSNPRRAAQFLLEWMSLRFDGSIAASKYLEHLIRRRSFALRRHHPVCWLPYAYNPEELEVDEAARAQLRAFADGRKLIVSLGTLNVHYGSVFLLDALAVLSAMRQDWVAVCPGSGQDLELTRNHCKQLGLESRVRYPGYVDRHEVGSHLVSANVLVSHLNDTEQDWARCPSKTYLYLGAQRPIVTPAIGENPIALGASGFYYDGRSPESMAQALSAALDAERNGWTPPDPSEHTWKRRVEEWVQWLYQEFPQLRDGSRK